MAILGYIDPGAGSLVVQAIIAAALSVPFFFRSKLRSAVTRLRRTSEATGAESPDASEVE